MPLRRRVLIRLVLTAVFLLLLTTSTQAQEVPGIYDSIVLRFEEAFAPYQAQALRYGAFIYWFCAVVELVISGLLWGMRGLDVLWRLMIKFILLAVFYALVTSGVFVVEQLIESFGYIGGTMSGLSTQFGAYGPSAVIDTGYEVSQRLLTRASIGLMLNPWTIIETLMYSIAGLAVLFVFMGIAFVETVILVEIALVVPLSPLMLGFAGLKETAGIAASWLAYAARVGIRFMTMLLIVGAGLSMAGQFILPAVLDWSGQASRFFGFEVVAVSMVFLVVIWVLPARLADAATRGFDFDFSGLLALSR